MIGSKKRFSAVTLLLTAAVLGAPASIQAALLIVDAGSGAPRDNHQGTVGMVFRTGANDLVVDALGIWDEGADGLLDTHDVGLFSDGAGGALVASATIQAGTASTLVGEFRYEPIAPVTLLANSYYTVGAQYPGAGSDRFRDLNGGAVFDLTGLDPASSTRAARWVSSATLTFPNNQASLDTSYVGPNLQYTVFGWTPPWPTNRAPGGTASGHSEGWGSAFEDGIDGNRNGQFGDGSVWHSADDPVTPAFYEVDLGNDYYVDRIQIAPRRDAQQGSVENFRLTLFADDGAGNPGSVVWTGDYLPTTAADWSWGTTDPGGAMGRHVRIERLDTAPAFMTFAEFEVYASETPLGENVALGKPVTASPGGWGASAGDGNDGDIDGDFYNPGFPVYHSSAQGVGQFWEVDLGDRYDLDYLELFGRSDAGTTSQWKVSVLNQFKAEVASSIINSNVSGTVQDYDHPVDLSGTVGQFIRVETTRNEFLAFAELRAFGTLAPPPVGPLNVAPGGTASGHSEGWGAVFKDGIDGNRDGLFGNGSVWHSADDPNTPAFYEVDLGKDYYVDRIQIAPRTDIRQGSVENFRLTLFADDGAGNPGAVVWTGDYLPTAAANYFWGTTDPGGTMGRHVRIDRLDADPPFMTFAEFEVYASETPLGENIALGKPVTASPGGWGAAAGDGNDGDIDGDFYHPGFPVYHSDSAAVGQFWQVDLQAETVLDYVELFERTDAGTTSQFLVSLLDADQQVVASEIVDAGAAGTLDQYNHMLDFGGLRGQFVRVETTRSEFLAFAELRVFSTAVPEPSTWLLLTLGGVGLAGLVRRKARHASHRTSRTS